jgi:hypothetical protein
LGMIGRAMVLPNTAQTSPRNYANVRKTRLERRS